MIRTLRRQFIATNMLLVSLVLLAVFAVQGFSVYRQAADRIYRAQLQALDWLAGASSPSFVFERPPQREDREPPQLSQSPSRGSAPRGFSPVPTFAVELDAAGQVIDLWTAPGTEVSSDTAQDLAERALAQASDRGRLPGQSLSYLCRTENGRRFIAFAENSSIGETLRSHLAVSLLICAAALFAFYWISRYLAKRSLRPVEKAWEQQRQFVADASHELKTPVTVILANADILLSHRSDTVDHQAKWVDYIRDEAGRMKGLVDDLLFLAKSDAAKRSGPLLPLALDQVVMGALLPFQSVAFEAGVTLSEQISPDISIRGDQSQLHRLVAILLDNAIKYAGPGGAVSVCLTEAQGRPQLSVHNTGSAIPPEHLPHLFERFYRSDAARDRQQGGYGLGLAIAKSIAEVHGGRIAVSSSPEAGTTFTVSFSRK